VRGVFVCLGWLEPPSLANKNARPQQKAGLVNIQPPLFLLHLLVIFLHLLVILLHLFVLLVVFLHFRVLLHFFLLVAVVALVGRLLGGFVAGLGGFGLFLRDGLVPKRSDEVAVAKAN